MRRTVLIAAVAALLACAACKSSASSGGGGASAGKKSAHGTSGTSASGDGQTGTSSSTNAGGGSEAGQAQPSAMDGGTSQPSQGGAGMDAGRTNSAADAGKMTMKPPPDAAAGDANAPDALVGMLGMGSCCEEHTTPGCSNADLQVCVCEKVPSCCTTAWNTPCVLIVKEKYCQPGVRDCVCGTDAGQWGQTSCCDTEWTETFCNQVAETKCGAVAGCF